MWRGNAFFICFGMSGHDLPHPRRSLYTPPVSLSPQRTRTRTTQHRQQRRLNQIPGQTAHSILHTGTHDRTLDTLCRVNRDGGGRWTACAACPKLSRFGHTQT